MNVNEMNEKKVEVNEMKNNEMNVEVKEMKVKEFSVKELCEILRIKEGTFRSWMLKVVEGEVYYRTNINYVEICRNVRERYKGEEERIEKLLGCKIEEVRIVKRERVRLKGVDLVDVVEGGRYEIRNYSLKYNVVVKKIEIVDEDIVYLCKEVEKNEYKVWTQNDLMKDNIKIVEVEEE